MNRTLVSTLACALLALATAALSGCKKDDVSSSTGAVALEFEHTVGTTPLVLGAGSYQNARGESFSVSTFKYYLSNLKLNKADGSSYAVPDTYFLVDQTDDATQHLTLGTVPTSDYTSLTITIGVDSARTKAGNFSGVLDAGKGMFWTMNGPEFINLKLEGYSPQAPHAPGAATGGLVFHIAGYRHSSTNTIRTVTLPFPTGVRLLVRSDHTPEVHLRVDAGQLFGAPNPTSFATTYNIMGGPTAARLADNAAAGMFSVEHIHAN